jgi:cytoskeletal protein CcmA (bactofilin family)
MVEIRLKNLTLSEYNFFEDKHPEGIYDQKTRAKLYSIIAKLEKSLGPKSNFEKTILKKFKKSDFGFLIPRGSESNGKLHFNSVLQIEGKYSGEIIGPRILIVGVDAIIKAKVTAQTILCKGSINGNVTALEKLEILKTGSLIGNVNAPSLHIEQGALFKGKCHMPINIEKISSRPQKLKKLFFLAG